METLKRALAVVESFRLDARCIDGGKAVYHELVNLRSALFGDFKAERHAENGEKRVVVPNSITEHKSGAFRVVALRLAPHVTHDVIGEIRPDGIGRRWQALDEIRHLFCAKIQRNTVVLRLGLKAAAE